MTDKASRFVGLGGAHFDIAICIANRPGLDDYPNLELLRPLQKGEVAYIAARTSNHWRKVFNVFAKFIFELRGSAMGVSSWQEYRDTALLQGASGEALLFSPPDFVDVAGCSALSVEMNSAVDIQPTASENAPCRRLPCVHIIAGKTYAKSLNLPFALAWQDSYFAINFEHRVIVSPYLDYRQLSNARIAQLVGYVKLLQHKNSK